MAGPCGCEQSGCSCVLVRNPASPIPYAVSGAGSVANPWALSIGPETVSTLTRVPGTGRLTYTNESGATITFEDGEHYAVDVVGLQQGDLVIPNVAVPGYTSYGPANPLTVSITNPHLTRSMSVHTTGTGHEFLVNAASTATNNRIIGIAVIYNVNGALLPPLPNGGNVAVPLRNLELRTYNLMTAAPVFAATIGPGASWFISVSQRRYVLSAPLNAGTAISQGERIVVSGRTTV